MVTKKAAAFRAVDDKSHLVWVVNPLASVYACKETSILEQNHYLYLAVEGVDLIRINVMFSCCLNNFICFGMNSSWIIE